MMCSSALSDLVNDWSSKSRDDLYHFVPYTWQVCFLLKQFELITLVNEYNWIDCFGSTPENGTLFSGTTVVLNQKLFHNVLCEAVMLVVSRMCSTLSMKVSLCSVLISVGKVSTS